MKSEEIGANRQPDGTFGPGNIANPNGRPPETEESRLKKKAQQKFIDEYVEELSKALPLINPIQVKKALEGDMVAIKNIEDRVMGKPQQKTELTNPDGNLKTIIIQKSGSSDD